MQDLLLAADVLVTDHSSLLFDFALTGRPMVFYRPDDSATPEDVPEAYLQPVDLPGRVVTSADELPDAILTADQEAGSFAAARTRLRDTWLPIRDGRATGRVVDILLAPDRVADRDVRRPTLEDM